MKILVTGADGFVGVSLVSRLLEGGHNVVGAVRRVPDPHARALPEGVGRVAFELNDEACVRRVVGEGWDVVIHLAAVASGSDALRSPIEAWEVNAVGTARLALALGKHVVDSSGPLLLVASTAEVYGIGEARPRVETDPPQPVSPYAASKLAAEIAALEVNRRMGLRVIVTRAFAHTGPDQDDRFVVPAFASRIALAKAIGAPAIKVGRLDAVRECMHVSDVVAAYVSLIAAGEPGEIYNIASGVSLSVRELFDRLSKLLTYSPVPELDQRLVRPTDIPHLVGDSGKLRRQTGWVPQMSLDQTLQEVTHAKTN